MNAPVVTRLVSRVSNAPRDDRHARPQPTHGTRGFQEAFQELADLNGATSVSVTFGQEAPHLQLSAKGSNGSRYTGALLKLRCPLKP